MAVTHDVELVANGITLTTQGDLVPGGGALLKMDTDEISLDQHAAFQDLMRCLGKLGSEFGAPITSLSITAI